MGNIYVKSCSKEGNRIQYGSREKIYFDVSEAQLKDPYFQKAFDIARDAYKAVDSGEISDLEILNVTNNCVVIGATFKYENKKFKLNVFKNKLNENKISSYTQIFPLSTNSNEVHMEVEFKGTKVAQLIERSMEHYLHKTLG